MARRPFNLPRYLRRHAAELPKLEEHARKVEGFLASVMVQNRIRVHLVSARAKTVDSIREKIQRKKYKRPGSQLTDKVGARIITYYRDDVDSVVEVLRERLKINARLSVDKRTSLGLRSFGYRSVHLIAKVKTAKLPLEYSSIRELWFEVQVRSVLEHAWAEIEHEVVYKSGIVYPDGFSRRFAALAGSLEILDSEFLSLSEHRLSLIEEYRKSYGLGKEKGKRLDAARLIAFLECEYPNGFGWRRAEREGKPLKAHSDALCVNALTAGGLITANSLEQTLRCKLFRRMARRFADHNQISVSEISHFAAAVMAVAIKRRSLVDLYFPELAQDPALTAALSLVS